MKDIFFQEKGKKILLALTGAEKKYVTEIAKDIDGTYAHTFNLVKEMEKQEIVASTKEGRTKLITLTPKGRNLAENLKSFITVLGGEEKSKKPTKSKTPPRPTKPEEVRVSESTKKLQAYSASLKAISREIKSKKLKKTDIAKIARKVGRYRSLALKLRPKTKEGKELKTRVIANVQEITDVLKKG
jgi:DNA-binding MarR family transcriptional regulator